MNELELRRAIEHFLAEDIGFGDQTTEAIIDPGATGRAIFVAKEAMVAAGLEQVAGLVFKVQNPAVRILAAAPDGIEVGPGDIMLRLEGPVADLLRAERVALNLAQRLCGIATLTRLFVNRLREEELTAAIVDTRKTTPGLRMVEKYAVRAGGGRNHRFGLADGILIKDNHIAACGSITVAVERVRSRSPHGLRIEVEAENLAQVRECLACGVDIILLDNMDTATLRQAVELVGGRALLEASGNVNLDNVREIAATGVDLISIGALTHSAPARDISMRFAE